MKQFKKQKSYRAFCTEDVFSAEVWSQSQFYSVGFSHPLSVFLICPVKKEICIFFEFFQASILVVATGIFADVKKFLNGLDT